MLLKRLWVLSSMSLGVVTQLRDCTGLAMLNSSFANQLEQILDYSTREELKNSGEKVLVELYGGKTTESLYSLRIRKFENKVVRFATSVKKTTLPPSLDAG